MPQTRIRTPFAAGFAVLILLAGYLGLSATERIPSYGQSDKGLHFITFFLVTVTFYWIFETSRRRLIHLTLLVCTAGLAIGSEFVQHFLPNDRIFDAFDILANVVGSALGLMLCSWYHKRMLERKRKSRQYDIVPGEEEDELGEGEHDLELGEGPGLTEQESGTVRVDEPVGSQVNGAVVGSKPTNVTAELDEWDENAEDWDDEPAENADGKKLDDDIPKKRTD